MPKMTAKRLREEANAYFDGRRVVRPKRIMVPMMADDGYGRMLPVLDQYGHQQMEQVVCRNGAGDEIMETVWYAAPTIAGLCLHIGVNKSTFYRWLRYREADGKDKARLRDAAMEIEAVIEDYLTQQSFDKTASRGAIAQLEHNYWRSGNGPTAAGAAAQDEDSQPPMSMAELEEELRQLNVLPREEG